MSITEKHHMCVASKSFPVNLHTKNVQAKLMYNVVAPSHLKMQPPRTHNCVTLLKKTTQLMITLCAYEPTQEKIKTSFNSHSNY